MNKSIYIPQIEGKDLWLSMYETNSDSDYSITDKKGKQNLKKYKASFDYSLDLIKSKELFNAIYNEQKSMCFKVDKKQYSNTIINVTFEYSAKEYNQISTNLYIRAGYNPSKIKLQDSIFIEDGELMAVKINTTVQSPVTNELLGDYFSFDVNSNYYTVKKSIKTIASVANIRKNLYEFGFNCNGIKYKKWKRSSGSARVGKCLFIDEKLYEQIHKWDMCGLDIKTNDSVDLAALESYISLTSSSIIDTINISAKNILVIDDYKSIFEDNIISVEAENDTLIATPKQANISNSIFDGESIIDKSLMGTYSDNGMILLRNRFFKSCCFNGNVQEWFIDNDIKKISQLNGFTLADDISEILLITTPSSIKYLKFGTLKDWFEHLDPTFGIVKHEEQTHFMDGKLVQSHYQLINTIQLSMTEVKKLLEPTFNLINQIKRDPDILRFWLKYNVEEDIKASPIKYKTDVIYKMLSVNNKFCQTKLYYDFKTDYLKAFTKNLKYGHILIEGNYSTLCGNPIEMLQQAIGSFTGKSIMEENCVYSTRFNFGKKLLGSRSPHITMSNILITENKYNQYIDKYMNPTNEIIFINSINKNILHKLAGCDFDSDTILLTDNKILIKATERNDNKFRVAVCNVHGNKNQRKYNEKDCAELDAKISKNAIGEIINLSQELNSIIWDSLANGEKIDDIKEIYLDVCKLSILSGISIDEAKKEFSINVSNELKVIRKKYTKIKDGKAIKPIFFAHIAKEKGYYNPQKKSYTKHKTSMDFLQSAINSFRTSKKGKKKNLSFLPFSDVVNQSNFDFSNVNIKKIKHTLTTINQASITSKATFLNSSYSNSEKFNISQNLKQDVIDYINQIDFDKDTIIELLKSIEKDENKKYRQFLFYVLFGCPNKSFYNMISKSKENIQLLQQNENGTIDIFGEKYSKF